MSRKSTKPTSSGPKKPDVSEIPTGDEPAVVESIDTDAPVNNNPALEADTTSKVSMSQPGKQSTEGWTPFDPACQECSRIIQGKRADKCPECGKIMHPYCYQQHFMRNHLPKPEALTISVKGTLMPDGGYGDYKGFIKPE